MNSKIVLSIPFFLFILLSMSFYLIFIYSPEEAHQGLVQKIFYFHVSSAFAMYFGFLIAGLGALLYLTKKKIKWDHLSYAGVSSGFLFCSMVLVSGPIWAKPIWGTWWTWDPRLTTTLILWLIFLIVILLRRYLAGDFQQKTWCALLTLFGVLDIPFVFLAVKLWRGIHPAVLGGKENMPAEMKLTLIYTSCVVLVLFTFVFWLRYKILQIEEKISSQ